MSVVRVLHVVNSLEPGGMENGICNLARELEPRGITMRVACLERSGPFAARLANPAAVDVLGKGIGFSPKAVFALRRTIQKHRPHVVHSHNFGPLIYGALATFWGHSPVLFHGEHSQLAPWELTPNRLKQRRRFYRACRAIHTVSGAQREELIRLGFDAEPIVAIPNGVNTARFRPRDRAAARQLLSLPGEATIFGLVGRFGPHKGHRALLDAFARIAEANPRVVLVLIGGGGSEEAAVAEAVATHPYRDRLRLTGFCNNLEECYPAFDLLLVPSTNEGMSNAALEAMACGVPVLANSGTGNEALITHGKDGWVEDLREADAAAQILAEKLGNLSALRATGENARQTVESQFSLVQMVTAYERWYRRLAA